MIAPDLDPIPAGLVDRMVVVVAAELSREEES